MSSASTRRLLLVLALLPLAAGCASTGHGKHLRVQLEYFGQRPQRFEIVSESYADRVAYYSEKRTDAARKFQSDEVMQALLDELDRRHLKRFQQPGRAPSDGRGVVKRAFEIERGGGVYHWSIGDGSEVDELQDFIECTQAFLQLYSSTPGYQTIENDEGAAFFEKAKQSAQRR